MAQFQPQIQAKLHRWARDDPHRRFNDVFNPVADPAFLLVAWDRVRHNKGAKTAGVDGVHAGPGRSAATRPYSHRLRRTARAVGPPKDGQHPGRTIGVGRRPAGTGRATARVTLYGGIASGSEMVKIHSDIPGG